MRFGGMVTENKLQDKRGKYMDVKMRQEDSVEAVNEAFGKAWQGICKEEIMAKQEVEEAARQMAQQAIQEVKLVHYYAVLLITISNRLRNVEKPEE
jgi:hypothetical protein